MAKLVLGKFFLKIKGYGAALSKDLTFRTINFHNKKNWLLVRPKVRRKKSEKKKFKKKSSQKKERKATQTLAVVLGK